MKLRKFDFQIYQKFINLETEKHIFISEGRCYQYLVLKRRTNASILIKFGRQTMPRYTDLPDSIIVHEKDEVVLLFLTSRGKEREELTIRLIARRDLDLL